MKTLVTTKITNLSFWLTNLINHKLIKHATFPNLSQIESWKGHNLTIPRCALKTNNTKRLLNSTCFYQHRYHQSFWPDLDRRHRTRTYMNTVKPLMVFGENWWMVFSSKIDEWLSLNKAFLTKTLSLNRFKELVIKASFKKTIDKLSDL